MVSPHAEQESEMGVFIVNFLQIGKMPRDMMPNVQANRHFAAGRVWARIL